MENNECFVKDIYAAAALLAAGKSLLRLQKEAAFYWFVFDDKPACENLLNEYWRGEGSMPPKNYADAIKTLKDRLFAQK